MAYSAEERRLLAMPDEAYMDDEQRAFFRRRLFAEREIIGMRLQEVRESIAHHERGGDELDQAAGEEEMRLALRQADRETRLLRNIDTALRRLDEGEYGYCEETGLPIGLARLMFRPTARLCVEAKARQEQRERHYHKARGDTR
ncbi:TraR/DksA family transcriptional regulator [Halomonas sp. M4R1S46]|uniref:TraR/DksA family transcriptional regulator n=1 Tax=Halomonas sp. M4R1S46 TaxID=2982692 RepID=UPI0021E39A4D|nr:TraR/DksA C4-type zinc finger protein [Halomonas sp. M4R1S46]UYG09035.1 TraR/DksA C4-type zinc finger protein [Halomonas sp. M4R1S46]